MVKLQKEEEKLFHNYEHFVCIKNEHNEGEI